MDALSGFNRVVCLHAADDVGGRKVDERAVGVIEIIVEIIRLCEADARIGGDDASTKQQRGNHGKQRPAKFHFKPFGE
jgi:hypothetical protein